MRKLLRKIVKAGAQAVRRATKPEEFALARKLAVLERGGYVGEGDPLVAELAAALSKLAQAAHVPELRAADICVRTRELAVGRRSLLQVITEIHDSIPADGLKGVRFEELAGAYLTLLLNSPIQP